MQAPRYPILASFVALLYMPLVSAQSTALASLDELLQGIDTLAADVIQVIVESDGGVLEESDIVMRLKKPNGFYWETTDPFPELVVTDGNLLWNYQPDLEQVVIEPWDNDRSELAAQLLNGRTENLAEEYLIDLLEGGASDITEFRLVPLATDSIYEDISISFRNGQLDMIHLDSINGEQTVWSFLNVETNPPLDDALFVFDPPEGIEIIENSYTR